jgi:hypothetical protein
MTTPRESEKLTNSEAMWTKRQPKELNYLRPNGFRFFIQSLPQVTYFCQAASIPTVNLGYAVQATSVIDIPYPGEKVQFSELTIKFMVQEDMENYIELFQWMADLGGVDGDKYSLNNRTKREEFRIPGLTVPTNKPRKTDRTDFSDATLIILGSNESPVARVQFFDCFPISLSSVDFDVSSGNTQYFTSIASFKYRSFEVDSLLTNP